MAKVSGKSKNYTAAIMLKAIKGSKGVVSNVANKLDCDWMTADKYIKMYPECVEAMRAESESMLDKCENVLFNKVEEGDTDIAKWVVSKKGKDRGYGDQIKVDMNVDEDTLNKLDEIRKKNK